jgi:hypothetical protein
MIDSRLAFVNHESRITIHESYAGPVRTTACSIGGGGGM